MKIKKNWQEFDEVMDELAFKIFQEERNRKQKFLGIYPIPRGGMVMAVALSHRLGIPIVHIPYQENIIIVDDISDKGNTFNFFMKNNKFKNTILTVSWFVRSTTSFVPDVYYTELLDNSWIIFPWEKWRGADKK